MNERQYERDHGKEIYAWQSGHLKTANTAIYGFGIVYPSQLQPELLDEYRRISMQRRQRLGFLRKEAIAMRVAMETPREKRRIGMRGL